MKTNWVQIAYEKGYRASFVDQKSVIISSIGTNMKLRPTKNGYLYFRIRVNNPRRMINIHVHSLVAYQKYGDAILNEDMVTRHRDGNKLNNSYNNILIGTMSENMLDIPKKIRVKHATNAASYIRKFTDEEENEIREMHKNCDSYKQVMEKYEITSKGTLHYILNK